MSSCSPLLALPPELRNNIYDIVKADQTDYTTISITDGSIVLHPLTRTCRQLRKESSSVLQPANLNDTTWISIQVFNYEFDALNKILLSFPVLENRIVILHTTIMLTAPGAEDMNQLHRWLATRHTEASRPLASPGHAFDHFNRFHSARIDWSMHDLVTANSNVHALASLKLGRATKGCDASGIHCAVATAAKRRQNELMGVKPGRSMLGTMGRPRNVAEASVKAQDRVAGLKRTMCEDELSSEEHTRRGRRDGLRSEKQRRGRGNRRLN